MDPSSPKSVTQVPDYIKEPFWGDMNIAEPGQRVTDPTASTPSSPPFPSLNVSSNNAKSEANVHTITAGGGSETVPTVSASAPIPQGLGNESVKDPTTAPTPSSAAPQEDYNALSVGNGLTEGQSEGPFAAPATTQSETVSSGTATSTTAAPSSASPPERNRDRSTFFTGRKYFDVTYFVPLHKWLNEGGSKEDYYWRPAQANVPLPEANRASHNS